ncbi:hypothetical protein [Streptomyces sp. NBC_01618]|uniref:hypothetical protein n=1 Tax=Streptomyces sp. NBC_01618 TaxID=2975900 RepID=UPI003866D649|nr:hypothetical protein OH735_28165 [Streptomyces sp. NBC_01618]
MSNKLARGMGSFFKPCECRRPSSCPHLYTIRFRNTRGKQAEESGFPTQDAAIERLTELHTAVEACLRQIGVEAIAVWRRLACCDATGRWSAAADVVENHAEQAAAAYSALSTAIEAERAEFRSSTAGDWSVVRAASIKAQRAKEKARWDGLPRREQAHRRTVYASMFSSRPLLIRSS